MLIFRSILVFTFSLLPSLLLGGNYGDKIDMQSIGSNDMRLLTDAIKVNKAIEEYKTALKTCKDKEKPAIYFNIAHMYLFEHRMPEEGVVWLKKAADSDHHEAMLCLGECYFNGTGLDRNHSESFKWFNKYYDKEKSALVEFYFGKMYLVGLGVKKNPEKAFQYFKLSVDKGFKDSLPFLADFYFLGRVVDQDYNKAMDLYRESAKSEQGNANSSFFWAECLKKMHQFKEAERVLIEANRKFPKDALIKRSLCTTSVLLGKFEQADKYYDEAQKIESLHIGFNYDLACAYLSQKKYEKALQISDDTLEVISKKEFDKFAEVPGIKTEVIQRRFTKLRRAIQREQSNSDN